MIAGFVVSSLAVALAAWLGYCAGRAGRSNMDRILDHRCPNGPRYRIGCLECGSFAVRAETFVPMGTKPIQPYRTREFHDHQPHG